MSTLKSYVSVCAQPWSMLHFTILFLGSIWPGLVDDTATHFWNGAIIWHERAMQATRSSKMYTPPSTRSLDQTRFLRKPFIWLAVGRKVLVTTKATKRWAPERQLPSFLSYMIEPEFSLTKGRKMTQACRIELANDTQSNQSSIKFC